MLKNTYYKEKIKKEPPLKLKQNQLYVIPEDTKQLIDSIDLQIGKGKCDDRLIKEHFPMLLGLPVIPLSVPLSGKRALNFKRVFDIIYRRHRLLGRCKIVEVEPYKYKVYRFCHAGDKLWFLKNVRTLHGDYFCADHKLNYVNGQVVSSKNRRFKRVF